MTTTTDKQTFVEVTIKMRLGVSTDFRKEVLKINDDGLLEEKTEPNYGQPYYIKSQTTGKVDNRNYQISEDTDWVEFKDYLRREMIYVPAGYFELLEAGE